jgi:hypothetical protein
MPEVYLEIDQLNPADWEALISLDYELPEHFSVGNGEDQVTYRKGVGFVSGSVPRGGCAQGALALCLSLRQGGSLR